VLVPKIGTKQRSGWNRDLITTTMTDTESESSISSSITQCEETQKLIVALANRSYHLPGYGFCEDLCQYLNNNHPLLGICCHHKIHPIKMKMRLLTLFGSILFGLTVSNIFFLLVLNDERFQDKLFAISINEEDWYITSGILLLWTVGGGVHAFYDITIWYIAACSCCPFSKKCRPCGTYSVVIVIILLLAIASFFVVLRAALHHEENEALDITQLDSVGLVDDQVDFSDIKKEFGFLQVYAMEFALALLVYYPFGSLILFSGLLGCGKLPILGGRPREIFLEKLEYQRQKNLPPV
jgi:hypothetical protein